MGNKRGRLEGSVRRLAALSRRMASAIRQLHYSQFSVPGTKVQPWRLSECVFGRRLIKKPSVGKPLPWQMPDSGSEMIRKVVGGADWVCVKMPKEGRQVVFEGV